MEVKFADTFLPSLKRMINSEKWWHWRFWQHRWYDLTWAVGNYIRYFRIVGKMRPWDYSSNLKMMKFQVDLLYNSMKKYSNEVEWDLSQKLKRMERFIELANHKLEDDYTDRCGFDYDYEYGFDMDSDNDKKYKLLTTESKDQKDKNSKALKEASDLEEKEWNEMIELLKDMRSWWH